MSLKKHAIPNWIGRYSIIAITAIIALDFIYKSSFILLGGIDVLAVSAVLFLIAFFLIGSWAGRLFLMGVLLLELLIASLSIDFSSDGLTYHVVAAQRIVDGITSLDGDLRIDSNPPLPWVFVAVGRALLSNLPNINTFGDIFLGSSMFLYLFYGLSQLNFFKVLTSSKKYKNIYLLFVSIAISMPPIFFSQLYSGYQDYWTYFSFGIYTFSLYFLFNQIDERIIKIHMLVLMLSIYLVLNTKFQTVFLFIFSTPFLAYVLYVKRANFLHYLKRYRWILLIIGISTILSFSFIYLRNFLIFDSIVPTASAKGVGGNNILFDNIFYKNTSEWKHLFYSIFSLTALNPEYPSLSIISVQNIKDMYLFGFPDLRFGASGPIFPIIVIASLASVLFKGSCKAITLTLLICLILVFLPGVGTLRYYPIIQFIPLLFVLIMGNKKIVLFISFLVIINSTMVFLGASGAQLYKTIEYVKFSGRLNELNPVSMKFTRANYHRDILSSFGVVLFSENKYHNKCQAVNQVFGVPIHEDILICGEKSYKK